METRTLHVPGFAIGTAEDRKGLTGVTVILAPEGGILADSPALQPGGTCGAALPAPGKRTF